MDIVTSPANALDQVIAVEDAFHRLDADFLQLSEDGLDHPRVRLIRALATRLFVLPLDPQAELAAAAPTAPIDRSLAAAVEALVTRGPAAARAQIRRHVRTYPSDTVGLYVFVMSNVMSAVPGAREEAMAYLRASADPGDWRTGPHLAMALQEAGEFENARALAERALAAEPSAAHAVHVLAHVHYETGEHATGAAWLDTWMSNRSIVMYDSHFRWHGALHALAAGDVDGALQRYRAGIKPTSLVDAGSMLWRCSLHAQPDADLTDQAAQTARRMLPFVPFPMPVFYAAFSLATARDLDGLLGLADDCAADPRPGFADLAAPLARALASFVAGDYPAAVEVLDALLPRVSRIGGSRAQREIVDDTLIEALLRMGDATRARTMLEARLARRPHALDEVQLHRAVVAGGDGGSSPDR
jgi:tetratricopeptide (TPR) repeat protein